MMLNYFKELSDWLVENSSSDFNSSDVIYRLFWSLIKDLILNKNEFFNTFVL